MEKEQAEPITIVSGLPRSGTSMMMRMLEAAGIPPLTDHVRTKDDDNRNGYYEFERVKALAAGDIEWIHQARGKAVKVISALLKHLPSSTRYHVIFMQRIMREILASQKNMLINRGEEADATDDERMAELFRQHLHEIETWLALQTNMRCVFVDYNRVLVDPASEISRIVGFLGNRLDLERMCSVVDPSLYRQKLRG